MTSKKQTPPEKGLTPQEKFNSYLEVNHYRKTPERFALLNRALRMTDHFGVDELYTAMEKDGYHVSRATVYSTLELLCNCGVLNRHRFGSGASKYEVAMGSHFHLICTHCGKIRELEVPAVQAALASTDYGDFTPGYFSTIVNGICADCRRKLESPG